MRRKYGNSFRYQGLARLDHCVGEDWQEVWADPCWATKPLTANRARFLYRAIQKQFPELIPAYGRPRFLPDRRYILVVRQDDRTSDQKQMLWIERT